MRVPCFQCRSPWRLDDYVQKARLSVVDCCVAADLRPFSTGWSKNGEAQRVGPRPIKRRIDTSVTGFPMDAFGRTHGEVTVRVDEHRLTFATRRDSKVLVRVWINGAERERIAGLYIFADFAAPELAHHEAFVSRSELPERAAVESEGAISRLLGPIDRGNRVPLPQRLDLRTHGHVKE